jgi:hypothetical protein
MFSEWLVQGEFNETEWPLVAWVNKLNSAKEIELAKASFPFSCAPRDLESGMFLHRLAKCLILELHVL